MKLSISRSGLSYRYVCSNHTHFYISFHCIYCSFEEKAAATASNEMQRNEKRCDEKTHLQHTKILLATFCGFDFSIVLAEDMNVCTLCWKSIYALSNLYPIYKLVLPLLLLLLLLHFSRRLPFVESAMKRLSNVYHTAIFLRSCSLTLSLSLVWSLLSFLIIEHRSFLIGLIRWCAGFRLETHII